MKHNKKAFTLIELLVVVLIIGILAAVALPQYQKAVIKARLTQLDTILYQAQNAIELWRLENGYPPEDVIFTGKKGTDISLLGNCNLDDLFCYTKLGRAFALCGGDYCSIQLDFKFNESGTQTNSALGNAFSTMYLYQIDNQWYVQSIGASSDDYLAFFCRWIKDHGYKGGSDNVYPDCESVGVILEKFEE